MSWLRRLPEAPVTLGLIVVNLLVFAIMVVYSGGFSFDAALLERAGATTSEPGWRWLTAAFIHGGPLHIFMNMLVLAQIGVLSERAIGRGLFLATYLVTGTLGNVLSTALASLHEGAHVSVGASGAIMGLIGVAVAFAWRTGQRDIAKSLAKNVLFVLVVGFTLTAGGALAVDNAAHIGGLVGGALIGLARARFPLPAPRWLDRTLIAVSGALVGAAFLYVHLSGHLFGHLSRTNAGL
jgi:rhomboid protease GluP